MWMTDQHKTLLTALAVASMVLAVGCGSTDDDSLVPPTSSQNQPSNPSAAPATTADETTTATTITPPTSTTRPTTTTATSSTTTAPSPPRDLAVPIPTGNFSAGPNDLFVLSLDGDLELWFDALTSPAGQRTLVADYPDPFGGVTEGPGPNVIDHVAGVVDGSVVFGDCCEPISGTVLAATDTDEFGGIAGGHSPTLSPTGDLLGTANTFLISQTSADRNGEGISRQLNEGPQAGYLNVGDLTWSDDATSAPGDDHMVLLGWTEQGWWLHDVDRSTLALTPAVDLGVPPVRDAPDTDVRFAGHGPGGEIVVAVSNPSTTRLRYFAPTTLAEVPLLERSLPGSATSIQLADDGFGLLWVDGGSLYHLPAGGLGADRLGRDVLAVWPAQT